MFRFDCTFSNFNCTKRVQLHTILRPDPLPLRHTRSGHTHSTVPTHFHSAKSATEKNLQCNTQQQLQTYPPSDLHFALPLREINLTVLGYRPTDGQTHI